MALGNKVRLVLAICAALFFTATANAATLISTASINVDGTWSIVDTTGTNAYLPNDGGWGSFTAINPGACGPNISPPPCAAWSAAATSITTQLAGAGWGAGFFVVDLTSNLPIGTVSSFPYQTGAASASLNLTAGATNGGNAGDLIGIAPANFGYTTLTTSFQTGANFNLASETVQGFAVKLAQSPASGPTGTLTAEIVDASNANAVVCHQIINIADLPVGAQPGMSDGGWVVFTCIEGTFVTNAAHNYQVWAEVSSTSTPVALWTNGTAANFSRLVITTGTKTAAASDNLIITAQLTGQGTHNGPYNVAIETTTNTVYGSASNTLQSPSIAVGQYGTLAFNNAASTNYAAAFAGPMVIYNGGTFSVGTSGSPIPSGSSATLTLNATSADDTGIIVKNGGTLNVAGVARTSGKNVVYTQLSTTANAAQAVLAVQDDTGWLNGDQVAVAGTVAGTGNFSSIQTETGTLSGNAGSTSMTLGSNLTHSHLGQTISYTGWNNVAYSEPQFADVLLLARNVKIQGSALSTPGYLYFQANSIANITWAAFNNVGGANGGQTGVTFDTGPGGSLSMTYSLIENSIDGGLYFGYQNQNWGGSSGSRMLVQNVGMYNVAQTNTACWYVGPTINPFTTIDKLTMVNCGAGNNYVQLVSGAPQMTNITCADCSAYDTGQGSFLITSFGISNLLYFNGQSWGTTELGKAYGVNGNQFGPIRIYASNSNSLVLAGNTRGTLSGAYLWNNNNGRMEPNLYSRWVLDPYYDYEPSNTFGIYGAPGTDSVLIVRNGFIGYGSGGGDAALTLDGNMGLFEFDNMDLCPTSALNAAFHAQGCTQSIAIDNDIPLDQVGAATVIARNTSMSSPNNYPTFAKQTAWLPNASILNDCPTCPSRSSGAIPSSHIAWLPNGVIQLDSAIFHSAKQPYSTRMIPLSTVFKGYISGYTLNITSFLSGIPTNASALSAPGIISGTSIASVAPGSCPPCIANVNVSQTLGSSGTPSLFQGTRDYLSARMQSAPQNQGVKVAVASGGTVTACVWVRESSHLDSGGVDYAGDPPRLIVRADPAMGIANDTVLAAFQGSVVGQWQQLCGTTPASPADGEFEVVVDADESPAAALAYNGSTPGWINIADWLVSGGAVYTNGTQQFWNNGVAFNASVPNNSGTTLVP